RGIERERREVAERADHAPVEAGAERVARVLDQGEAMTLGDLDDARGVERVAERVREHDRARPGPDRLLDPRGIDVVRGRLHVNEDGDATSLEDRIDDGGE